MPFYEYQCTECEHYLEKLQKISDAPLVDCPSCGKSALKKLISAPSFRLKGKGWYETDFKTGDKKNLAASESQKSTQKGNKTHSKESSGNSTTTSKSNGESTTTSSSSTTNKTNSKTNTTTKK